MFLDRLNTLLQKCGLDPAISGEIHETIDVLDAMTSFDTTGGLRKDTLGPRNPVNPVGKRLSLHEGRMSYFSHACIFKKTPIKKKNKFFFWIGHEACCPCGCGEHRRL